MTWEELNKDNIEQVKQFYIEYLEENKENNYMANLMPFEEFINKKLKKCNRCETIILNEKDLCECCNEDLYEI